MGINFIPRGGINPIFGIKLAPAFCTVCESLKELEAETLIKKALNINENRAVSLKDVEDSFGNTFQLLVIYDQLSKRNKEILRIPHTEEGYFDFPIYNLDFNSKIDIEFIIENGILAGKHNV